MTVKAGDIFMLVESLAPLDLAESWDNCGLQLGCRDKEVKSILVALDIDRAAVDAACRLKADLVISHHPLFFKGVDCIDFGQNQGQLIRDLIQHDITVYSAHTNLDSAPQGLNEYLAGKFELQNIRPLGSIKKEELLKLVVYVPLTHIEEVRAAICEAGAGHIGNYSDCSFRVRGTGTFRPLDGTSPYLGSAGVLEEVEEYRLETVIPKRVLKAVVSKMIEVHPYEEVAYDLFSLAIDGAAFSYGRVGELARPVKLETLACKVKKTLGLGALRYIGGEDTMITRVAVVSGAGASMISEAIREECDVLITGDIKYHEAKAAADSGLCLIDAEHDGLELAVEELLADKLQASVKKMGWKIRINRLYARPIFSHL
ncbi:MAG: Nif3-like dinuclear metal center hexameric protein [Candidatus Saccharibacteria bacterium]